MPASFSPIFDPASAQAAAISDLFKIVLVICGIILLIVVGMVGISLIRFASVPARRSQDLFLEIGNSKLFGPSGRRLIVVCLFALTARGMRQADPPANQEPDLIVIGHQWWWEIRYPQTGVTTANEIHLPVGRKFLVRLESADVIHDFWVPALARKMQLIPGQTNHIWLAPTRREITPANASSIAACSMRGCDFSSSRNRQKICGVAAQSGKFRRQSRHGFSAERTETFPDADLHQLSFHSRRFRCGQRRAGFDASGGPQNSGRGNSSQYGNQSFSLAEKSAGHQNGLLHAESEIDRRAGRRADELFGDPQMSETISAPALIETPAVAARRADFSVGSPRWITNASAFCIC
jgi:hypothetical protein